MKKEVVHTARNLFFYGQAKHGEKRTVAADEIYPLNLRLQGRRCTVIGGGEVALRKVLGLVAAGAEVLVIAPEICPKLFTLAENKKITWLSEVYAPGKLAGSTLVVVASDDLAVNRAAAREARACGGLVNAPGEPESGDFFVPAVLRRGKMMLTVSTGGVSPAVSRALRRKLENYFPENFGEWLDKVALIRAEMKKKAAGSRRREKFWRSALSDRIINMVQAGELERAEVELRNAADGFGVESPDGSGENTREVRTERADD